MRSLCLVLALAACAPKPSQAFVPSVEADGGLVDAGVCPATCSAFTQPRSLGLVQDPLVELSGLVASHTQPVFFAHNDSGDTARFFAISTSDGRVLQEFRLENARAVDWEDIALGPCPGGSCVYLGDIGDNRRVRTDYAVFRVPEPAVTGGAAMSVPFERIAYEFPNAEKHNAEALLADPRTGRLYLITKEDAGQPSLVFRFPSTLTPSQPAMLERLLTLAVPTPSDTQVTGADVSPCGDAVLVRLYNRLVLFTGTGLEAALAGQPRIVPSAQEPQGEAVAFLADGSGYVTASEALTGPPPLNLSTCR